MNYIKKYHDLVNAIKAAHDEKKCAEKELELNKLSILFKKMLNERMMNISCCIDRLLDGDKDTGSKEHMKMVYRYMCSINDICKDYCVDPVFLEAENSADMKKIDQALETYLKQLSTIDSLTRDMLEQAIRSGDFGEYFEYYDSLVEKIDVMSEDIAYNVGAVGKSNEIFSNFDGTKIDKQMYGTTLI